jgi:hypothetical protein
MVGEVTPAAINPMFQQLEEIGAVSIEESSEPGGRHWLHLIVDIEQIEGALL